MGSRGPGHHRVHEAPTNLALCGSLPPNPPGMLDATSLRRLTAALALLATVALTEAPAFAKVTTESPYSKTLTYNGALRFIRVDQGFELIEQDQENGYLLFKYRSDGDTSTGSIEVVEVQERVKYIVQLPRMPQYHEQVLSDGLHRKLREEYGEPPRRERKEKDDVIRRPDDRSPDGGEGNDGGGEKGDAPRRDGETGEKSTSHSPAPVSGPVLSSEQYDCGAIEP